MEKEITMKEIERLILLELLAKINLDRAKKQFNNDYVYGSDDVIILISSEIKKNL